MFNFNPVAFLAYTAARQGGKSFEQAKSAFWSATRSVKRKDTVTGVLVDAQKVPYGLKLGNGRKINWSILAMKLKNDELEMSDEQRGKLKSLLVAVKQEMIAELV